MSRILVADDDRMTRHVLRKVLTSAGFTVTVAKDGVDALKALRHRRFDLLLLDVWMPRMNGLDLLERLRTRKSRPRVIVMTSDDAPETLLEAVRQQAFKYVHKPIASMELLQTVREVLKAPELPAIEVISARPGLGRAGRPLPTRSRRTPSRRDGADSTPISRRTCASRSPTPFASC